MPKETFYNLKKDKMDKLMTAIINELSNAAYDYINIQNIIKEAGIARGSFYQYFKDKDDMYQYFMGHIGEKKMTYFKAIFEDQQLSFIDRIEALYKAGLSFKKAYPKYVKAGEYMMTSPLYQNSKVVKDRFDQILSIYEGWIIKDQRKGLIRDDIDAKVLAQIIMDFLNKMTIDSFIYHKMDETTWEDNIKTILDIFRKGILKHV